MARPSKDSSKGPMIHVRLDEKTHRCLKILVAKRTTTIQQLVEDLICNKVSELGSTSQGKGDDHDCM